jgi:hypothetical protein
VPDQNHLVDASCHAVLSSLERTVRVRSLSVFRLKRAMITAVVAGSQHRAAHLS